jgi:hypothetical protein
MVFKGGWACVGRAGIVGASAATGAGGGVFLQPAKEPASINKINANHLIRQECAKFGPISMNLLR